MSGRIAVVDEENRFLRWEERRVIHERRLLHRSIHILLFDRAGRLVVQRRHASKQTYPRFWDVSCCGHVEESDYQGAHPDADLDAVYARVAHRELVEELGVDAPLELLAHLPPTAGVHYEQIHLYRGTSDGPFVLQADEVAELRAVTAAELAELAPITDTLAFLAEWLRRRGVW